MTFARRLRERLDITRRSSAGNDPPAFVALYYEMSPKVLRYFAHATGDPHVAFDLMAETFAKAYEKRHDFRGQTEAEESSWVWTIARNELAMYHRSRGVERAALHRLEMERPDLTDEEIRRIEQLGTDAEVREHLANALVLLPAEQREAIRLRFLEDRSYDEIAAHLDVSNEVVRARCSRGLRTLRENDRVHAAVRALEA
jgi:RNA polymerase sigma-70 factor (ECF subfamily)